VPNFGSPGHVTKILQPKAAKTAKNIFQRFAISKCIMVQLSSGHTYLSQLGHFLLFFSYDQSLVPLTPPKPLNVEI